MTAKRFGYVVFDGFEDNGEYITPYQVVGLLNELAEENEQLKHSIKCLEADKMELQQYIKRTQGDVE